MEDKFVEQYLQNLKSKRNRPCECCGKEFQTGYIQVFASKVGPVSFGYCGLCLLLDAEADGMQDFSWDYLTFDKEKNKYIFKNNTNLGGISPENKELLDNINEFVNDPYNFNLDIFGSNKAVFEECKRYKEMLKEVSNDK